MVIEMVRDSPAGMVNSRLANHAPLLLYHEVEKDKDLLPVNNNTILLFIKLYDPKTENLKVRASSLHSGPADASEGPSSCNGLKCRESAWILCVFFPLTGLL